MLPPIGKSNKFQFLDLLHLQTGLRGQANDSGLPQRGWGVCRQLDFVEIGSVEAFEVFDQNGVVALQKLRVWARDAWVVLNHEVTIFPANGAGEGGDDFFGRGWSISLYDAEAKTNGRFDRWRRWQCIYFDTWQWDAVLWRFWRHNLWSFAHHISQKILFLRSHVCF